MEAKRTWQGYTFGGKHLHRWLIALLKRVDIRVVYVIAAVFVVPVCLFLPGARHCYRYLRHRLGCGTLRSLWGVYRNHVLFSQVVIDRFAMYAGRHFKVDVVHYDDFLSLAALPDSFVMLSSHVGNYEIAGYTLVSTKKPFNALVFGAEKATVMTGREHLFGHNHIRMIPIRDDMSHLIAINNALSNGEILSMPADRIFGSPKAITRNFLGAPAKFPEGPFRVVTMRQLSVLAVNVMKTHWNTYTAYVHALDYDREAPRRQQMEQLAAAYTKVLESDLQKHPLQWYNYFDFWNQ